MLENSMNKRQASETMDIRIEHPFIEFSALPSNKHMELTVKSVTPFAGAKAAPLLPAAHVWR